MLDLNVKLCRPSIKNVPEIRTGQISSRKHLLFVNVKLTSSYHPQGFLEENVDLAISPDPKEPHTLTQVPKVVFRIKHV